MLVLTVWSVVYCTTEVHFKKFPFDEVLGSGHGANLFVDNFKALLTFNSRKAIFWNQRNVKTLSKEIAAHLKKSEAACRMRYGKLAL